jgi:hypothetical protein
MRYDKNELFDCNSVVIGIAAFRTRWLATLLLAARGRREIKPRLRGMRQIGAAPPDHGDVPVHVRFGERHAGDGRMLALLRDRLRQKGGSHACGGKRDNEIDLAAARDDSRLEAVSVAGVQNDTVQCKSGFEQNERQLPQGQKVDGPSARERVARRQQDGQGLALDVFPFEAFRRG